MRISNFYQPFTATHQNILGDIIPAVWSFSHMQRFGFLMFSFLCPILTLSPFAYGKNFSGLILKKNSGHYLMHAESQQAYLLTFTNDVAQKQIQRLKTGDYASMDATLDAPKNLNVTMVDYIGLGQLLGVWRGDDSLCYEFKNFTTLFVSTPDDKNVCSDARLTASKYSYFINPDVRDWNLLLSSEAAEYVGELIIKKPKRMQINLFDDRNDGILRSIHLRR